jgi:hypothetical protein
MHSLNAQLIDPVMLCLLEMNGSKGNASLFFNWDVYLFY